jgi:hypothetical protein
MKKLLIIVFVLLFSGILKAQEQQVVVPYTLADRDRTIRLEAKMETFEVKIGALESKMDVKFEAVNARIDYLFWLQGVIVALILFILGYTIWDRKTALQPALVQASKADENSRNLIATLREYAKKHADLAEILRTHGIL